MSVEPMTGQGISMFWASDQEAAFTAYKVVLYRCGRDGLTLETTGWPRRCLRGHLNYPPGDSH